MDLHYEKQDYIEQGSILKRKDKGYLDTNIEEAYYKYLLLYEILSINYNTNNIKDRFNNKAWKIQRTFQKK